VAIDEKAELDRVGGTGHIALERILDEAERAREEVEA